MNSKEIIEQYNSAVVCSYGRLDLALECASGAQGTDADGRSYIDFGSGIGTNSLGYADREWADAVSGQAQVCQAGWHRRRLYSLVPARLLQGQEFFY